MPYYLDSLEPTRRDRLSDFAVLSDTYEPLVMTDARLAIVPGLATHCENPDEKPEYSTSAPPFAFTTGARSRPTTSSSRSVDSWTTSNSRRGGTSWRSTGSRRLPARAS